MERHHGEGNMGGNQGGCGMEKLRRGNHGEGIMEEDSWKHRG